MRSAGRVAGRVATALVASLAGALLVLSLQGLTSGQSAPRRGKGIGVPETASRAGKPAARADTTAPSSRVLLAWAPDGLPRRTERKVEASSQVEDATTVYAGVDWLESTTMPNGNRIDAGPPGFEIPLEVAAVEPVEYARFVPPAERDKILTLRDDRVVLAATAAELRGAGEGIKLVLEEETVVSAGVISDVAANGYEALRRVPPPAAWERTDRFLLIHLDKPHQRRRVEDQIRRLLGPGRALQTRIAGENPFLRYGDAVLPQMLIKETFGEFAARPNSDGSITVDPQWRRRNIKRRRVPILGPVTCHRTLFPQLVEALKEVRAQGLAHVIHPRQFAGCYSPRFINSTPGGRISHHSWGIAVDLNARENVFGTRADLDRRVVEVLDRWGFTWGGRWIVPDGMHFEWVSFPR